MDITNIPQSLIKGLEQKNTEQLTALSRVLNLVLGKTETAMVTSTAPVTAPERAELLKQTTTALAQLNKQIVDPNKIPPALKAEISRLVEQQNLIQKPDLKWINLTVNNRPQLTYSDRPLVAGQSIPVQLQGPQKLVMLNLPVTTSVQLPEADIPQFPAVKTPAQATQAAIEIAKNLVGKTSQLPNELLKTAVVDLVNKLVSAGVINMDKANPLKDSVIPQQALINPQAKTALSGKPLTFSTEELSQKLSAQGESKNTNPETQATKKITSENLRNLLPLKDTPNLLLSAATKLESLPPLNKLHLLPHGVEQALKSLATQIRSPEQLGQPKVLAQALKNSGVLFEHKLGQLAQNNFSGEQGAKSTNLIKNTYNQDLKGALLTLLNRSTQELGGDKKPISNEQTQKLIQNLGSAPFFNPSLTGSVSSLNNKNDIAQAVGLFIQQLMQKPVKELSNKELRTQLLVLLQQHSVHSLAKIQLQQLHSITHELDTKDSANPSASWQLEIPVKHNNDVQHMHVRIDRDWVDDKNESDSDYEKSTNKVKQWSVTLRFDLPTLGEFCAQLAIINTQVSATLWAAREKTFTQVSDQIDGLRKQLESEGINVKYLQCMRGIPPEKPMALSYSLIDIST
ncbi:MAG: flagellar hook-length control protein FliK [Gammaproteobacteria bacterium]|nr:MAG: flagellar hook-length control protein FliK [Gammaproteobacteria bacterium]